LRHDIYQCQQRQPYESNNGNDDREVFKWEWSSYIILKDPVLARAIIP